MHRVSLSIRRFSIRVVEAWRNGRRERTCCVGSRSVRCLSSFSMVHRLVGNAAVSRLHELLRSQRIKGFILPYLGQLDAEIPTTVKQLVTRSEVIGYPTDFAAMPDEWIDRLSTRGEQMTRVL